MGKRTRTNSNEEFDCIAKMFRRLEGKLLRARRRHRDRDTRKRSSSDSGSSSSGLSSRSSSSTGSARSRSRSHSRSRMHATQTQPLSIEGVPITCETQSMRNNSGQMPSSSLATDPMPSTSAEADQNLLTSTAKVPLQAKNTPLGQKPPISNIANSLASVEGDLPPSQPALLAQDNVKMPSPPELDIELLEILGEDPSQIKIYGKDLQSDLAVRLQHIATTGLSKATRKDLLSTYLPPGNCMLIDAPTLNPEVKAAVSETVSKRDKNIEQKQRQLASAVTCIAEALTLLLSSQQKNTALIKLLMDANRILCDCQNMDSTTRRNFVLSILKKDRKDQLQATMIDKFLFSKDLAETLKTAKAISKSGADMKLPQPKTLPKKINKPPAKNLNWRAPPPSHRPKGTPRMKEPAYKSRHETSSRQSSRPGQNRGRR